MRHPSENQNAVRFPLDGLLGSEGSIRLLRVLSEEAPGGLGATDAAERAALTPPGARKALSRLERTGFVVQVSSGRSPRYALRADEPLLDAVRELFRAERSRYHAFVGDVRGALVDVREIEAAWIDSMPTSSGEPTELSVVAEAKCGPSIKQEIRTRLAAVEKRYDLVIEVSSYTLANAPAPDWTTLVPVAGVIPRESVAMESKPALHSDRDQRALLMSRSVARLLRRDPALSKRALRHLERVLKEDPGTATGDLLEWRQLLETYSPERVRQFLVSTSSRAVRLRQSSPFFAVLTPDERDTLTSDLQAGR
jgi:DNA-binding Lrp family transcriptional regulator